MPIHTLWLIPERVVYSRIVGEEPDAVTVVYTAMQEIGKTSPHIVHAIIDDSYMTGRYNLQTITQTKIIPNPNAGCVVVVGSNQFARMVSTAIGRAVRLKFSYANTLEQGEAFLLQQDRILTADQFTAGRALLNALPTE
ncbi:MAG: hypothetical protein ACOYL5_15360 [Phototrophicaceae bacterium]|jgi:hypothetical protein